MTGEPAIALMRCLEAYQAALLEHEDAVGGARDDVRAQVDASEQVIVARLALYRCLVDLGWQPPPDVADSLEVDELVASMTTGAIGG